MITAAEWPPTTTVCLLAATYKIIITNNDMITKIMIMIIMTIYMKNMK